MKVLLTGANGFLGSHILDRLLDAGHHVVALLRATSDTTFIQSRLDAAEVRGGSLDDAGALEAACRAAEAVVHCAGKTKALRRREYHEVNAEGTRRLTEACNAAGCVRTLVLISSLAVTGPGTRERPAREEDEPRPVSLYGRSKLAGEGYVRELASMPYTILRPAAIYGPRDRDFLLAFRMARRRLVPLIGGGRKAVSTVYAADVADAVLRSLERPALRHTYHVAHPEPASQRELLLHMARAMGRSPTCVPVPELLLYPVCALQGLLDRIRRRPGIMNLQKVAELRAPGWVCSTDRAALELGFTARTGLEAGIRSALDWYTDRGWL